MYLQNNCDNMQLHKINYISLHGKPTPSIILIFLKVYCCKVRICTRYKIQDTKLYLNSVW